MSLQAKVLLFVFVAITCVSAAGPFLLEETVQRTLSSLATQPDPTPSGLTKDNYLQTIAGITNYFRRNLQNSAGRIIDPILNREVQYATPCYAYAALVQGYIQGDARLITSGIAALNASLSSLVARSCADGHCNFFTLPIMLAIEELKPHISQALCYYMTEASKIATSAYTNNDINWGLVAAGGEFVRYQYGLTGLTWIDPRIATHLTMISDNGLYADPTPVTNPSTAYDLYPRVYLENILYRGYNGTHSAVLSELMGRASKVSLLMQSPKGEWPNGGRSSQHLWNDAAQCALYEMRATQHWRNGEVTLAKAFKRAARLAHQAFMEYISQEGYHFVVKNKMPISQRHGYETYTHLTNYNGLPASMLALAYQVADDSIPEGPSFAEHAEYVIRLESHNKIIANLRGNYYEWETKSDTAYDSTGLIRVHHTGNPSVIGPTATTAAGSGANALAVGLGWTKGGVSQTLAQYGTGNVVTSLAINSVSSAVLDFTITYDISGSLVSQVVENVNLVADKITISTSLTGAVDTVQFRYPIFLDNGVFQPEFDVSGNRVFINEGITQTYSVVSPAGVSLTQDSSVRAASRNGFIGLVQASVPATEAAYVITISQGTAQLPTETYTVGSSSEADFATIGAALAAVSGRAINYVIEIEAGVYAEQVVINTPNGVLRGLGDVVIRSAVDGAVLSVQASNVKVYGVTVANTLQQGTGRGSAVSVSGAEVSFYSSKFLGFTNTLSFSASATVYVKDSYVEGADDVVFGSGKVYFDEVTIASSAPGSISAHNGVSPASSSKFVFNFVTLVATAPSAILAASANPAIAYTNNQAQGTNFLGRAVGDYSRVAYTFTNIGSHVNLAGWAGAGHLFMEFQNTGAHGAFGTERLGVLLSGDDAVAFSLANVFADCAEAANNAIPSWIDASYTPQCGAVFHQCGGINYDGPTCCRAPYSCIAQNANISQCIYVPLSPRGDGTGQIFSSGTIALNTIYVSNPLGTVTYSFDTTDLSASYKAEYSNAVLESIVPSVSYQLSPVPAINISLSYSALSDPRNIGVDLHINLPVGSEVEVVAI